MQVDLCVGRSSKKIKQYIRDIVILGIEGIEVNELEEVTLSTAALI